MEKLQKENPGSLTSLEHEEDGKTFKRLFIFPAANQVAFRTCRPMIIVDACHLRSKYGGILMSACAHDGLGKIVPLAIAISEVENESNWVYFFLNLRAAIDMTAGVTIMHDREKGLLSAQICALPDTHESICVFHLEKNVNALFKSKFGGKIWEAAKATTEIQFKETMRKIHAMNPEAANYLLDADPNRWATAYFPVPRFGCVTSNSAESLNSWMESLREGSHLSILVGWISKVAVLFYERKEKFQLVDTDLPATLQRKLRKNTIEGQKREIHRFSEGGFLVANH
jgi:zinc finger SWIM domain-containing protein 3